MSNAYRLLGQQERHGRSLAGCRMSRPGVVQKRCSALLSKDLHVVIPRGPLSCLAFQSCCLLSKCGRSIASSSLASTSETGPGGAFVNRKQSPAFGRQPLCCIKAKPLQPPVESHQAPLAEKVLEATVGPGAQRCVHSRLLHAPPCHRCHRLVQLVELAHIFNHHSRF